MNEGELLSGPAWSNYERGYESSLESDDFLAWRALGARRKARNIICLCDGMAFDSIVEIGCGTGDITRQLAASNLARSYAAADLSWSAVRFAREHSTPIPFWGVVTDASSLPFGPDTFDLAVLSHVLEHLPDPARATREGAKVARQLVIEVPIERVLSGIFRRLITRKPWTSNSAGHIQFWTPRAIEKFLRNECQLQIRARRRDLISPEVEMWGKHGARRIYPFLKRILKAALPSGMYIWLFTSHVAFLCRRIHDPNLDTTHSSPTLDKDQGHTF